MVHYICFGLFTEFRDRIDEKFPVMAQFYGSVSGLYLSIMPKRLRDQILEEKPDDQSTAKSNETPPLKK